MTMGPWGTNLERTVTWWNQGTAWLRYVARCQDLLQSGRFVADVCYFTGEDAPNDLPDRSGLGPRSRPAMTTTAATHRRCLTRMSVKTARSCCRMGCATACWSCPTAGS